ncbi:hypothetical protein [Alloalcanivorax marinus]|uniref:hypothetical protein n=1 Tax=Alloalcanivorax marinus TaxID=1177169 RepID=UPI0019321C11|nr:hypothetical protein [Alloalcanivorax marinus]MBL7251419.1 hypothetical protein [Alloalcanivorax marinus]
MNFKPFHTLALMALLAALAACGDSSSSSSDDSDTGQARTVTGTASAPSGMVASLRAPDPLRVVLDFLIQPAAAAITGLQPVNGATVELIRVDNDGNPVGEVLATTTTSTTGDYTLTLPQGVNLAGNLVVRIRGADAQMRAQVVEEAVNIDPTSEFLLREFIAQGTDLEQLVINEVVKLKGKVEAFDLTAGANLTDMLEQLDAEVGDLVENQVAVINDGGGDAATVAGHYRANAFSLGLHDSDDQSGGTFATDLYTSTFTFSDGGDGIVDLNLTGEESAEGMLSGNTVSGAWLDYGTSGEEMDETFSAALTASGILSVEGEFEEEVDDEHAFRFPPSVYNLQRVGDRGLFFQVSKEAAVRYGVTQDGALNPDDRRGDEAFRALEVFARTPTDFSDNDLDGDFGRVYLATEMEQGLIAVEAETNVVSFNGNGNLNLATGTFHRLGVGTGYETGATETAENLSVIIDGDGDIVAIGGEPEDGFINDTHDFISLMRAEGSDSEFARFDTTLMVKLPQATPDVAGNRYRMLLLSLFLEGNPAGGANMEMYASQFNTFLTLDSATQATLAGGINEVSKNNLAANLETSVDEVEESFSVDVAANGAATLTLEADDGTNVLDGFFNQDASLGLFTLRFEPDQGDPNELGLVVLVEVTGDNDED